MRDRSFPLASFWPQQGQELFLSTATLVGLKLNPVEKAMTAEHVNIFCGTTCCYEYERDAGSVKAHLIWDVLQTLDPREFIVCVAARGCSQIMGNSRREEAGCLRFHVWQAGLAISINILVAPLFHNHLLGLKISSPNLQTDTSFSIGAVIYCMTLKCPLEVCAMAK